MHKQCQQLQLVHQLVHQPLVPPLVLLMVINAKCKLTVQIICHAVWNTIQPLELMMLALVEHAYQPVPLKMVLLQLVY
jgi:hypothetical protein